MLRIRFIHEIRGRFYLSKHDRTGRALKTHLVMRPIAKRAILARSTTAKRDRRFARQIPLLAIRIGQHNMAFYAQRTVAAHSNFYCFF